MDGYMLINRIRTQLAPEYRQLLAIALTAYAGEANERQVLQAGFQKHLAKPIDPKQLDTTVARSIVAQRLENKAWVLGKTLHCSWFGSLQHPRFG